MATSTGSGKDRQDSIPRKKRPWRKVREARGSGKSSEHGTDLHAGPLQHPEVKPTRSHVVSVGGQLGESLPFLSPGVVPVEVDGSVMEGVS